MININRNPEMARKNFYDVIIIGGGIHGIMLALIASQRKLKTLLLERDDFGSATSFNSLRIIHGGFRYLQKMDLHRFFESVADRKWFLQNFPDLVEPIPCLIPLSGKGIYRPFIFKAALLLNDVLSYRRNKGINKDSKLPRGKVISANEVKKVFNDLKYLKLKGGAVWYDGSMPDSQKVMIETLKWACSLGTIALNYFDVKELIKKNNIVEGVRAYDKEVKKFYDFNSKIVINAAGPWSRKIAASFDKDYEKLFKSSIAWNILFNKKAISDYAIAVTPQRPHAKTYFLRPLNGMLFAGTVHEPYKDVEKDPIPSEDSVTYFIQDLNSLINNLNLKKEDILHIFSGHMPVKKEGTNDLSDREIIIDHSKKNGPKGLFSISGVKFTTARLIAEKTINLIFKNSDKQVSNDKRNLNYSSKIDINLNSNGLDESAKEILRKIIQSESVLHIDDLLLRRISLGDNPVKALELAPQISSLFGWDKDHFELEINRLKDYIYQKNYNVHPIDKIVLKSN